MSTLPPSGEPTGDDEFDALVAGLDLDWDDASTGAHPSNGDLTPAAVVDPDEHPEDHYDWVPRFRAPRSNTFTRNEDGSYTVRLSERVRDDLHGIFEDLRNILLTGESEMVRRLYPAAYPDHDDLQARYEDQARDELLSARLENLDAVDASLDDEVVARETLHGWMTALNDFRLVLGTKLDISEDDDEDDVPEGLEAAHALYRAITELQHELILALMGEFPGPRDPD